MMTASQAKAKLNHLLCQYEQGLASIRNFQPKFYDSSAAGGPAVVVRPAARSGCTQMLVDSLRKVEQRILVPQVFNAAIGAGSLCIWLSRFTA